MQSYLNNLTAFNNRYYDSATGKAASQWIFDTLTSVRRAALLLCLCI